MSIYYQRLPQEKKFGKHRGKVFLAKNKLTSANSPLEGPLLKVTIWCKGRRKVAQRSSSHRLSPHCYRRTGEDWMCFELLLQ